MPATRCAERQRPFFFGNRLFNTNWAEFPGSVKSFDGLGPTFNRVSCSGCHTRDGRGRPPESGRADGLDAGAPVAAAPDRGDASRIPAYGDQLSERAIPGVPPEGRAMIAYEDVRAVRRRHALHALPADLSLRRPRLRSARRRADQPAGRAAVIGLGLLEAVPAKTLQALADPDDADGDGISGRINRVTDHSGKRPPAGSAGRPMSPPREQKAGAALGDIGLTTRLFPEQNCPPAQTACGCRQRRKPSRR